MCISHWLYPSNKNKHHPTALRPVGLSIFLALFLLIPPLYNISVVGQVKVLGYATDISIANLHALSNEERNSRGLRSLNLDSRLNQAALNKANHMIANDYWAHVAPDGTTPWHFMSSAGYSYIVAGENLAKDFNTSAGVTSGWMGSPAHRANILSGEYRDVGYAVVNGQLDGSKTTLVVAMYGAEASPPPAEPVKKESYTNPDKPADTAPERATSTQQVAQSTEETQKKIERPKPVKDGTKPASNKPQANEPNAVSTHPEPQHDAPEEEASGGDVLASATIGRYKSLNWGQKASMVLIGTMMALYVMKHTIIWRRYKRNYRHIWLRSHPLGQAAMLSVVFMFVIASSSGVVL